MARDESRDFGAIRIDRDGSHIGRYMVQDIPSTPNPWVQVSGYPSADTQGRQWTGSAQITHTSNRRIVYPVATAPGHSGSPVFLPNSTTAVAIHHKFDMGVAYAVRLTKEVIDEIKSFPI
jgi:V8-like Glu-specific endopeptidase